MAMDFKSKSNFHLREVSAYGKQFYEIVSLGQPREIFGQTEHKMEIVAKCIRAGEDVFDAT